MSELMTDARGAAEHLHVSDRTLGNWRSRGYGPPYLKIGGKVLYRLADLDAWMESRVRNPEAA